MKRRLKDGEKTRGWREDSRIERRLKDGDWRERRLKVEVKTQEWRKGSRMKRRLKEKTHGWREDSKTESSLNPCAFSPTLSLLSILVSSLQP